MNYYDRFANADNPNQAFNDFNERSRQTVGRNLDRDLLDNQLNFTNNGITDTGALSAANRKAQIDNERQRRLNEQELGFASEDFQRVPSDRKAGVPNVDYFGQARAKQPAEALNDYWTNRTNERDRALQKQKLQTEMGDPTWDPFANVGDGIQWRPQQQTQQKLNQLNYAQQDETELNALERGFVDEDFSSDAGKQRFLAGNYDPYDAGNSDYLGDAAGARAYYTQLADAKRKGLDRQRQRDLLMLKERDPGYHLLPHSGQTVEGQVSWNPTQETRAALDARERAYQIAQKQQEQELEYLRQDLAKKYGSQYV